MLQSQICFWNVTQVRSIYGTNDTGSGKNYSTTEVAKAVEILTRIKLS